jgi:cysteinyl-tRNA synthetase
MTKKGDCHQFCVIAFRVMKAPVFADGALTLIGNTPLVRLRRVCPNQNVEVWAKLENFNPGGSVKDRVAKSMIEAAEASGELTHDKIILEATSGNTGIGLALVGAVRGYKVLLAMSEAVSQERCQILAALGAEFLRTPARLGTDGAIEAVYRLQRREPGKYFIPDQYNNPANPLAHYNGTAPEIWEQTKGRITHFVATMGTSGTLMGMSRRLKELNPEVQIIGVEPYLGHKIQGLKNMKEAYRPGIFDRKMLDRKINIKDEDAYETSRILAREEGLFVGMSAGAAAYVALEVARDLPKGVIVVILPDGGERYLSTTLFRTSVPVTGREPKLELYDSLTRAQRVFEPLVAGKVSMYSCGPTVNAEPTLGLLRRVVVSDLLRRYLEYCGLEVKHVMNLTDVDDNTIQESYR